MHFEWRVPVDDENTLSVAWFFVRVPTDREPYVQDGIPTWVSPVRDDKGEWIVSHIINQDIVGWASQGRIADRSHENLRSSDIGITMMRKRFFEDLDRIAKGQDPSSIVRDPSVAKCIALPDAMANIMLKVCRLLTTPSIRCCASGSPAFGTITGSQRRCG